jgi:hypothetical protein
MIHNIKEAMMAQGWLESEVVAIQTSLSKSQNVASIEHANQVIAQFEILTAAFSETIRQLQAAELKLVLIETALRG